MISEQTISEIKSRAHLVDLISEVTQIRRAGSRFVALCPFHSEKTPSFYINDSTNTYRCFGCGVSGNPLTFVMQQRGLSFPEAVEDLAQRFGITVIRDGKIPQESEGRKKIKLYEINQVAHDFFQRSLKSSEARVKEYLKERDITIQSIRDFGLGYAPISRNSLVNLLRTKGYKDELILETGLARRNDKGDLFDLFWGRLIFPVFQDSKRIAGFGGRVIPGLMDREYEKKSPKYLNSPETLIYTKNKILYGLPLAQASIRETGEVYLVEGYMDVLGLWQVGVKNSVASCGTAVGETHMTTLGRLAKRAILLFDGDEAGRRAAARSFKVFINSPIDVWASFLPEGEDPDTVARKHGDKTENYLCQLSRVPLVDAFVEHEISVHGGGAPDSLGGASKASIAKSVVEISSLAKESIVKEDILRRAAFKLGVKEDFLQISSSNQISKPVANIKIDSVETSLTPVTDLPRVMQEILRCAMVLRESIPNKILLDGELCGALPIVVLRFLEGLAQIQNLNEPDLQTKEKIKNLLKSFGESWLALWKNSYQMAKDFDVNMEQVFIDVVQKIKKDRLQDEISQVDAQLASNVSPNIMESLAQEKVALIRQLKSLSNQ